MSGKQDKKSRRLKQQIDGHMRTIKKKAEADRAKYVPNIIDKYNEMLKDLPFHKRLMVCYRILF